MTHNATFKRFVRFHRTHPEVLTHLHRLTEQWAYYGRGELGIRMLWERLRWELGIKGLPDAAEDWKLNNNYHAFYVRLLCLIWPNHAPLFRFRQSIADNYVDKLEDLAADWRHTHFATVTPSGLVAPERATQGTLL